MKHLWCYLFICVLLSKAIVEVIAGGATHENERPDQENLFKQNGNEEVKRNRKNSTDEIPSAGNDKDSAERAAAQNEARRRRKQLEREREGTMAAKQTIQSAADENCDWRSQPLSFLKGEVCGSHYKVLGLDRKNGVPTKSEIKKAYRQRSLSVHPDKNSSPEADSAFKIVQQAYECLLDEQCRGEYDVKLAFAEHEIAISRQNMKMKVVNKVKETLHHAHYYASIAAQYIYQTGTDIWDLAGELELELMGEPRPLGRAILMFLLLFKGRALLQLHALSYALLRVNYEISKNRGLFDYY